MTWSSSSSAASLSSGGSVLKNMSNASHTRRLERALAVPVLPLIVALASVVYGQPQTREQLLFLAENPWRVVGGETNSVVADGWVHFYGHVIDVQPKGILVQGFWREVPERAEMALDFFVVGFPYQVADGDLLMGDRYYMAKQVGMYTYVTVLGGSRTVRKLDYGAVIYAPDRLDLDSEARSQAKAKEDSAKKKADAAARLLKYHRELAAKGDPYGQYHMGLRYATGDGVPKDLDKARDFLSRAASQGFKEADDEFRRITNSASKTP